MKGYLLLDIPKNCASCPCIKEDEHAMPICGVDRRPVCMLGKEESCPIKKVPGRKRTIGEESEGKRLLMNAGWNECIDEITGEDGYALEGENG